MNKLNEFLEILAMDARLLRRFEHAPLATVEDFGLSELEQQAVLSADRTVLNQLADDESIFRHFIHIQWFGKTLDLEA
ncbi:hypothetical protein [Shewanella sp. GXUN23E]|uniref:hypothetical protein n=1 Tax=Shewanella sp. GXUN23E TaxID=3422498 RepID=UPI003D7E1809